MSKKFKYCPQCRAELVAVQRDGRQRQQCPVESCGWVHWNNPTPVVAAIVERNNRVVLVRNIGWPDNWYGLVTGFLEASEDPKIGVCREIKEEIGLTVSNPRLIGVYPFRRMNQVIIAAYKLGVPVSKLAEWYKKT